MLHHALAAARRGIRVFPLIPGGKTPAKKDWQHIATTDETVLRRWWEENPNFNLGGVVGLAIDADVKGGAPGLSDLAELEALDLLPATYTQATPSGGRHLLYATDADVPNSVKRIARGLDARGRHGFVVLAGSKTPAGEYRVLEDAPLAPAPAELVALCGKRRERAKGEAGEGVLADHPADVARAAAWLRDEAEPAIEGAGNVTTFATACRVRDWGVSEPACLALMLEHWNERCAPPWSVEELETIVSNAYRYASGVAGAEGVAGQFGLEADVEGEDGASLAEGAGKPKRFPFETISDLRSLEPPKWLVPGWFPAWAVGIVYGQWGSGKSFIVLDLLLHLAYGLPTWHGVKLPGVPMDVLLAAREGTSGFLKRTDAFRKHHGLEAEPQRLRFMRAPVNVMQEAEFRLLCAAIRESGIPFQVIALDTLARVMPGEDMNEQKNVTLLMERCQKLGDVTQATVIGVHHQNKGGGMLGSTFFEANADFVFEVKRLGRDTGPLAAGEIRCTKMKEGEDQWKRAVRYERIALDVTDFEDGEAPASLVVAAIEEIRAEEQEAGAPLEVIAEVLASRMERKPQRLLDVQKVMSSAEKEASGMTDEAVEKRNHTRKLSKLIDLKSDTETVTSCGILRIWRAAENTPLMVFLK